MRYLLATAFIAWAAAISMGCGLKNPHEAYIVHPKTGELAPRPHAVYQAWPCEKDQITFESTIPNQPYFWCVNETDF